MKKPKYIFVTGGVCSSLGKGIVASSLAAILKSGGVEVAQMKLDPYLNVDPGTMSPFQHGEVFILDDGSETDLDLGHYERFTGTRLIGDCSVTTGKIYSEVIREEREGKYLGGTIQVVPHITGKIQEKVEYAANKLKCEVMVVEIGGTVGDIEAFPFLEALRHMKQQYGNENVLSVHLTLLPYLAAAGELKTKPTQLSVQELRKVGIAPDMIFARADVPIPSEILKKISYFCNVGVESVIPAETVSSIYEVPLRFEKFNVGKVVTEKLKIKCRPNLSTWKKGFEKRLTTKKELCIGLAGKYTDLDDAYLSVMEAIKSAGYDQDCQVHVEWIDTEKIEKKNVKEKVKLAKCDGIVVPGGFGVRGTEGKIMVAQYCRENKKPYLGLCLGSHIMAIEFARNILGIKDATSEEFDETRVSKNHVVHFIPEQRNITKKGGTMRLGLYPCIIQKGTLAHKVYGKKEIEERHRHRYEFNNDYREQFIDNGFLISGHSPDNDLVEIVEVEDHPYMIGVQFHPELISRPFNPHPLFAGLIRASLV